MAGKLSTTIAIVGLFVVRAGAQTPNFRSDSAFLAAPQAQVAAQLHLQPVDTTRAIDLLVKRANDALQALDSVHTAVWMTDEGATASHPIAGLIFSRPQLELIRTASNISEFELIVRLIVAHERAHQLQYREYTPGLLGRPVQERAVYEAQADILAGAAFAESIGPSSNTRPIEEALRLMFDLGTEGYSMADHPSHESRRSAVRLGMSSGTMVGMRSLPIPEAQQSARLVALKLNRSPDETTMAWSLRTAQRITNFSRPAVADLTLLSERIEWDTSATSPTVSYWLEYKNSGHRDLLVDLEIRVDARPRTDLTNTMRSQLISVQNYQFHLVPGQVFRISDQQFWAAPNGLEPVLIVPPDPTSLAVVRFDPDDGDDPSPFGLRGGVAEIRTARDTSAILAPLVLAALVDSSARNFLGLRASPGRKIGEWLLYASSMNLPGAVRTSLWLPDSGNGRPAYSRTLLAETPDRRSAELVFASYVAAFVDQSSAWVRTDSPQDTDGSRSVRFAGPFLPATVTFALDAADGQFTVTATVRAIKARP